MKPIAKVLLVVAIVVLIVLFLKTLPGQDKFMPANFFEQDFQQVAPSTMFNPTMMPLIVSTPRTMAPVTMVPMPDGTMRPMSPVTMKPMPDGTMRPMSPATMKPMGLMSDGTMRPKSSMYVTAPPTVAAVLGEEDMGGGNDYAGNYNNDEYDPMYQG